MSTELLLSLVWLLVVSATFVAAWRAGARHREGARLRDAATRARASVPLLGRVEPPARLAPPPVDLLDREAPAEPAVARIEAPHVWTPRRPSPAVVLVHGFGGFDRLSLGAFSVPYFRGVEAALADLGLDVTTVRLPSVGSVQARATALARQLQQLERDDLHVVAHSMGGLDARWALRELDAARWVRSLTTVATPHRGTPLANLGRRWPLRSALAPLGALADLGVSDVDRTPDVAGVEYRSVVVRARASDLIPLLLPSYALLARIAGDNDGIVPTSSQPWGDVVAHVETDHWGAVGWSPRFDADALYRRIVQRALAS